MNLSYLVANTNFTIGKQFWNFMKLYNVTELYVRNVPSHQNELLRLYWIAP